MSTAILNNAKSATTKSQFLRYAWKEYRMLRGFWLALVVLGVGMQWVLGQLLEQVGLPLTLFATAWGTAALYAVGAAVTLFSAESEERTRGYLQLLPGQWLPMFLAKVSVAVGSSVAVGLVLCLTGRILCGEWPDAHDVPRVFGVVGLAVVEALVWGLLFSLKSRQPLLAAVAAMAAASLGAQLAVQACPAASNSFTAESYQEAAGYRLLLCLAVFALDVLAARHWLDPATSRAAAPLWFFVRSRPLALGNSSIAKPTRRRVLARLLWQSWRESWKTILATTAVSIVLTIALPAPFLLSGLRADKYLLTFSALVLPALFGATVFRADHQGDHRLFLSTHATWPRHVWFSRLFVWLGALAIIAIGVLVFTGLTALWEFSWNLDEFLRSGHAWRLSNGLLRGEINSSWMMRWFQYEYFASLEYIAVLGLSSVFTGFAMGQVFSLLLRREVLAGFLSLIAAGVLAAWAWVVYAWQLSPFWFVLPPGLAALVVTWLHIPRWFTGTQQLRAWSLVVVAAIGSVAWIGILPPSARLAQLQLPRPDFPFATQPLAESAAEFEKHEAHATQAIDRLRELQLARPNVWELTVDGKTPREYGVEAYLQGEWNDERLWEGLGLEPAPLAILKRFQTAEVLAWEEINQDAIPELLTLIESTDPLIWKNLPENELNSRRNLSFETALHVLQVDSLRLTREGNLPEAWRRLKALARLYAAQLTYILNVPDNLDLKTIRQWAHQSGQSSELLKTALGELEENFRIPTDPRNAILREYERSRRVVLEEELPYFAGDLRHDYEYHLAFLANRLPWERERSLQALEYLAEQSLNYMGMVLRTPLGTSEAMAQETRELLRTGPYSTTFAVSEAEFKGNWNSFQMACQLSAACSTSYLASREFSRLHLYGLMDQWIDREIQRRALLVELALTAYRLDHGEYPESLNDLTPGYLSEKINDPYAGVPFEYRPYGLENPLLLDLPGVELPAGTPLFWSVGKGLNKLRELYEGPSGNLTNSYGSYRIGVGRLGNDSTPLVEAPREIPETGREVCLFYSTEKPYTSDNLVFVLPK